MPELSWEDITLLRLNDSWIAYINMLLKHAYKKWYATRISDIQDYLTNK